VAQIERIFLAKENQWKSREGRAKYQSTESTRVARDDRLGVRRPRQNSQAAGIAGLANEQLDQS
jgi:hypothetical protein